MKFLSTAWLLAAAAWVSPALASDTYINATISGVVSPGVYGRIDVGNAAPPPLLYAQPRIISRGPTYVAQPVYLYVPPGHAKNWGKHCGRYNACARPVYFVNVDERGHYRSKHGGGKPPKHHHKDKHHKDKHGGPHTGPHGGPHGGR